jgi:hypothetical protein
MKNIHWAFRGSDEQPREGPFEIIRVHANGTVTMQKGPIEERLNTRQVIPHAI